jgi:acyl-CoA reductase-like NAD-dependent aldehyde dehydrogenase
MKEFKLLINGQLVTGASTMEVINPATGKLLTMCPRADVARLDVAVRRAKLMAIADALEANIQEMGQLLTSEQGKPLADAMGEVGGSAYILRVLSAMDLPSKTLMEDEKEKVVEHRTPLGVVAAITPWNYPLSLLMVKLAPALLSGNTVVSKPAPTTPLTTLRFAEICNEHLPPGVFNVITDQNDLGGVLTQHGDVAKVSFTGSTATGKKVMQSAASSLKRVTLELGGNDAAIVLDDVNPKEIAPKLFAGAMINTGQVCLAIKRIYVHESQYDAICSELAALAKAAVVGDGMKEGTQFGPLQNKMQFERVRNLIEDTRREGKIIAGGEVAEGGGYFIRPTIVRDIPDTARLVQEEQFGPIVPVLKYSSVDDALARANSTHYGLGGTVWSSSTDRALEVAKKIDSGIVWVNQHMNIHFDKPAGGSKQSGFGAELGLEGLMEYTQNHVVYVAK